MYVRTDEQLAEILTKGLAYLTLVMLVHIVRRDYDVYAVADCDSDNEYCESG